MLLRRLCLSHLDTQSLSLHRNCRPSLWPKLLRSGRRDGCDTHAQLFSRLSMLSSKPRAPLSLWTNDDEDKSPSQRPTYVTFLTDVEGDGEYLDRFVNHSKLLGFRTVTPSFGGYGKHRQGEYENKFDGETWNLGRYDEDYFPYDKDIIFLDDDGDSGYHNSMLVYGGDVWDKGGSDLYVLRQLLSLRRRYPHRVFFLMGNRDINKMRIVDELGVSGGKVESLPPHKGAYWLMRSGLSLNPERLVVPSESAAERVKWMLMTTMGSVNAFELRRSELIRERTSILNGIAVVPSRHSVCANYDDSIAIKVTDDEVAQSYIHSCCPLSGIMSQYLSYAKLVIKLGPVLFMHGALPIVLDDQPVRFPTPWIHEDDEYSRLGCESLTEWIGALDDFSSRQVEAWKAHGTEEKSSGSIDGVWATEGGYFNRSRAGKAFGALLQYGMGTLPDGKKTQSCVYNSWMHDGLPRGDFFDNDDSMTKLRDLLEQEGIQIILSGHQPVGDMPWAVQISASAEKTKTWVLACDTSFSGDTRWASLRPQGYQPLTTQIDNKASCGRGEVAFSEPVVLFCPTTNSVKSLKVHGRLSDGLHYESNNMMTNSDENNFRIGRKIGHFEFEDSELGDAKGGMFWLKGIFGGKYLVTFGKGYNVWNSFITT